MQEDVEQVTAVVPGVAWSVCVRGGEVLAQVGSDHVLPTASMGKVLLLLEVARRLDDGSLDPDTRWRPHPEDRVGDSGLWQHLREPDLSIGSLAVLVAAVSDNLATNVLLRHVGLDSLEAMSRDLGIQRTRVLDRIRDVRTPTDAPWPSEGCAAELSLLMSRIAHGDAVSAGVSTMVARWLALDVDTSMVASALGLDPLAHVDGPLRLFHKTGADVGVRADAGHIDGPAGSCSYAVLAHWDTPDPTADEVLRAMRSIGELIRERVA